MNSYYLASLVLFSLWDYYIPFLGGRVLDYVGIVLIMVYVGSRFIQPDFGALKFSRAYILLLMAMFPLVVLAYLDGRWLTATAFLLGSTLIYSSFSSAHYSQDRLHKQIGYLILFNLLFFFFQYAAYKLLGVVVDYHSYFGSLNPRTFNENLIFFRAAGLFQEPNSFSLTLFMLNVLRIIFSDKKVDLLFVLSLIALFLSESLWGIGAVPVLVFLVVNSAVLRLVLFVGLGAMAWLMLFSLEKWADVFDVVLEPVTVRRLNELASDPSVDSRYGGSFQFGFDFHSLFGSGLSTVDFQSFAGANAIGFYLYSFGLLGFIFFLAWLVFDSKRNWFPIGVALLFAMTSYPLFTYAFWWAWLGILIGSSNMGKVHSQPVGNCIVPSLRG